MLCDNPHFCRHFDADLFCTARRDRKIDGPIFAEHFDDRSIFIFAERGFDLKLAGADNYRQRAWTLALRILFGIRSVTRTVFAAARFVFVRGVDRAAVKFCTGTFALLGNRGLRQLRPDRFVNLEVVHGLLRLFRHRIQSSWRCDFTLDIGRVLRAWLQ